jgi:hypothetical protein
MLNLQKYLILQTAAAHGGGTGTFQTPSLHALKYFSKENLTSGGTAARKLDLKSMTLNMMSGNKTSIPLPFKKDSVYDVIVIGGGTGGLSFAQEARKLGMTVALFDYVQPSPQ